MIELLIRPHLKQFEPYRSARSEVRNAHILMDANELSLGSPVMRDGIQLNRYPDPYQITLREKLAEQVGLSADMVFTGVGSDEIIDLLVRLFCEPLKDSVAILEPTYGVYRVAAEINNVGIISIELDEEFHIDVDQTLNAISLSTKILFCCSPNNPTGNLLRRSDILRLCKTVNALVVVDQAYVEFADDSGDVTSDVNEYENLVVLKTLSKAWGLAGIRLGYCIANPTVISYLLRIKAPYNINALTSQTALDGLSRKEFLVSSLSRIVEGRKQLASRLSNLPGVVRVYPSDTNFLLVEFRNALHVYERLSRGGIIVRRRSEPRLRNCLRITVGTPEENNLLLENLADCA